MHIEINLYVINKQDSQGLPKKRKTRFLISKLLNCTIPQSRANPPMGAEVEKINCEWVGGFVKLIYRRIKILRGWADSRIWADLREITVYRTCI